MKRSLPERILFVVVLCSIPMMMLLVLWAPTSLQRWLVAHAKWLYSVLDATAPLLTAWPQFFGSQTAAAAALILLPLVWFAGERRPAGTGRQGFVFPALLGIYVMWLTLSCLWSVWPYGARADVIRQLPFFVLSLAAFVTCRSDRRRAIFAAAFAGTVIVSAILQGTLIVRLGLQSPSVETVRLEHGQLVALAKAWEATKWQFLKYPIFYSNKNWGCAGFVAAMVMLLGLVVRRWRARAEDAPVGPEPRLWAAVLGFASLLFILMAADSKAGYVAMAVGLPTFAFALWAPRKAWRFVVAGVFVALVGTGVVLQSDRLRTRVWDWATMPDTTTHMRVLYYTATAHMYADRPVIGWGSGSFQVLYPTYQSLDHWRERFTAGTRAVHPHNEYLRVAAETGTVGLVFYTALIAYCLVASYRALARRPLRSRAVSAALWGGCVAYLVQSTFDKAPIHASFAGGFWLVLGALAAMPHDSEESGAAGQGPAPQDGQLALTPWHYGCLAVVVAVVGWAWWDWGIGSYRSMVHLRKAEAARSALNNVTWQPAGYKRLYDEAELARPRCLWPSHMLYFDYVRAWHLSDHRGWSESLAVAERWLQPYSPDFMRTKAVAARCLAALGQRGTATQLVEDYILRCPYDLEGYTTLADWDLPRAGRLLEDHVRSETDGLQQDGAALAARGASAKRSRLKEVEEVRITRDLRELLSMYLALGLFNRLPVTLAAVAPVLGTTPAGTVLPLVDELQYAGQETKIAAFRKALPDLFALRDRLLGVAPDYGDDEVFAELVRLHLAANDAPKARDVAAAAAWARKTAYAALVQEVARRFEREGASGDLRRLRRAFPKALAEGPGR